MSDKMDFLSALTIAVSAVGGVIASLLGGADTLLDTLLLFMVIDIFLGVYMSAWKHKSPKTDAGKFSSQTFWEGITRKFLTFIIIIIAVYLDGLLGTYFVVGDMNATLLRSAVILFYIFNEASSILETMAILGMRLPKKLLNMLEVLKENND